MRFLQTIDSAEWKDESLSLNLDRRHTLRVEPLSENLVRVLLKKDGALRLPRTWSIAQGAAQVPLEGLSRDSLPLPRASASWNGETLSLGQLELKVHHDPFHLEWHFGGHLALKERSTGAVALGRRDHRFWHFLQLKAESAFYGLGERSGELDRRGRSFEMRNVDPMGYNARSSDPLYKHIPFYIEHHRHGFVGVYYDNLANARFNFGEEIDNYHGPFTSYRAEDGDLDYYLFFHTEPIEIVRAFSRLTGQTYFPPKWSLGYSSTSMTYTDVDKAQERLEQFLEESAQHQIPVKSFKYGSGYTSREHKRYVFTWNREKFPDAQAINQKFRERKIRLAANIKPVLLTDHPSYEEARPLFVRDSESGEQEVSQFWDNRGSHLDFSNPDTYRWWQEKVKSQLLDYGFDALWNDNNEYVIWDDEARCTGFGDPVPISLIRPLMSLWMTRASHEITQAQNPDKRVWSISRCGCPGMQRYAQTWSGDNYTAWETLEYNNKMALGLSLSGVYNIGHDVGGFSGPAPGAELLARWFFIGAFCPRFGVNSWKLDGTITEPWMHPQVLPHIQKALALRMRFLPQLYTLMRECYETHTPLLRPTFLNFPQDPECYQHSREMMWGDNLLIAPVLKPGEKERQVYLPRCEEGWWNLDSGSWHAGGLTKVVEAPLDSIPLFVRGNSALFLGTWGADTIDGPEEARELHLFPSPQGGEFQAVFYDDDGETHEHLQGGFWKLELSVKHSHQIVKLSTEVQGDYSPSYRELKVVVPPDVLCEQKTILLA